MKLVHIDVRNYRSLFINYDAKTHFEVELGDSVNAITGPNNAGKSNVLRALALALEPDFEFNRHLDIPAGFAAVAKPVVTLTFQVPLKGAPSSERTLIKLLGAYEQKVNPGKTGYSEAPDRIRATPRRQRRPRSSQLTARNPGHTRASTNPGALHSHDNGISRSVAGVLSPPAGQAAVDLSAVRA